MLRHIIKTYTIIKRLNAFLAFKDDWTNDEKEVLYHILFKLYDEDWKETKIVVKNLKNYLKQVDKTNLTDDQIRLYIFFKILCSETAGQQC